MLTPLLLLVLADPTPLQSKIEDVTLYGGSALVHRSTKIPGTGTFAVQGLPLAMDKDNVRVRCFGGDVLSVEVRDRQQATAPSERLEGLRAKLTALGRDVQAARDDVQVIEAIREHLKSMSELDARGFRGDVETKKGDTTNWDQSFDFIVTKIAANAAALRTARWKAEDAERAFKAVEVEIGGLQRAGNVTVRDVVVDVEAQGQATLDVEYMVSGTGWQPYYDLRTASDLASVDLGYRARIWQHTGEDWTDVAVALSTAEPQRGAQGPEPMPQWISLLEERAKSGYMSSPAVMDEVKRVGKDEKGRLAEGDRPANGPSPFATVQSQGLSVRFVLARRETIESRDQPTTVLVGRSTLAVTTERHCAPALDTSVWLRGKAKNTSEWTLLPGTASVFLGADYLGLAQLEAVQVGQEFTLHLGADPMISVKRTQTEDMSKGPGFLSSRAEKIEGWRVHFENHGAVTSAQSGAVNVIVREALPRSRDERIDVELSKSEPKESKDERWKQDLDEKGIHTWVLSVPRAGAADLVWQATITYPKGVELVRQ